MKISVLSRLRARREGAALVDDEAALQMGTLGRVRTARIEDDEERDDENRVQEDEDEEETAERRAEDENDEDAPAAEDDEEDDAPVSRRRAQDDEEEETAEDEEDEESMASPATVAQMCVDAGVPSMTKKLVGRGLTVGQVRQKLNRPKRIRALVKTARKVNPSIGMSKADEFIRNGASVAEVGEALIGMLARSQSPEISNRNSGGTSVTRTVIDGAVAKVNARRGR